MPEGMRQEASGKSPTRYAGEAVAGDAALAAESLTEVVNDGKRALLLLHNAFARPGVWFPAGSIRQPARILRMLESLGLAGFEWEISPEGSLRVLYRSVSQ